MRQEYSTLCTVQGGKLKIFDRGEFDRALTRFADGEELDLTIAEPIQKRTRQQEKFFHGPVLKAFMTLGMGKQEAKDVLALKFIPREIHNLDGTIAIVPGHTALLSKEEYTEFIEQCIQLAAELDMVVKDSDQWLAEQRQQARAWNRQPAGREAH